MSRLDLRARGGGVRHFHSGRSRRADKQIPGTRADAALPSLKCTIPFVFRVMLDVPASPEGHPRTPRLDDDVRQQLLVESQIRSAARARARSSGTRRAEPCCEPKQAQASGPLPAGLGSYCVKPSARPLRCANLFPLVGRFCRRGIDGNLEERPHRLAALHPNLRDKGLQKRLLRLRRA